MSIYFNEDSIIKSQTSPLLIYDPSIDVYESKILTLDEKNNNDIEHLLIWR